MLKEIVLKGYKSYNNAVLPLSPLTVLIGANASGKSNALEAFRLLCWLAEGQKLSVIKQEVDDSDQLLRGQVTDLGYLNENTFTMGCTLDNADWSGFEITLSIRDGELHIVQEKITSEKESFPLYRIESASTGVSYDVRVAYNNFARGGKKPQLTCTDQIAIMCQLESSAKFEGGHKKAQKEIPTATKAFQELLKNTLFLDPVPALMHGDSFPEKKLRGNCSNLSGVLYALWEDKQNRPLIIAFIKSLPEQDVKDLKFFKDRKGKVSLELVESFGGEDRTWSVELLSDGTLRVLAIAAALLSAPEGSTVVIEEIDNGVHPSRAQHLLKTMRIHAEERKLRLLLTTHNPALMDALPDASLGDVVFCYRDPEKGDSRLVRLSDLSNYAGLVSQGPLGELVTQGVVDRFVKHPVSQEDKKKHALEWLANMQGHG